MGQARDPEAEGLSLNPLQVEELLKEVKLSEKKKERIDAFLRELNQRIMRMPSTPETEVRLVVWGTGKPRGSPQWGHLKQGPCYSLELILTARRLSGECGQSHVHSFNKQLCALQ